MLNILEEIQWRLAELQASLHDENTINPAGDGVITHQEARKKVLWYLDSFSAAVAGARTHLNKVEENDEKLYTGTDKAQIRARIASRLLTEFDTLKPATQKKLHGQQHDSNESHQADVSPESNVVPIRNTANRSIKQQIVTETLEQLELLDQEIEPLREMLRGCVPENTLTITHLHHPAPTTLVKGSDTEYTIGDVATGIQEMREAFVEESTVTSEDDTVTTTLEAKKKVLWHLDQLAAHVAGAQQHIANFQADDMFSPADKDRMEEEIIEELRKKLMLEDVIKNYSYCLRRHFQHLIDDDYPVTFRDEPREIQLEKRQVIHEVLRQVEFIDRELEDFRCGLGRLAKT
jgi:hypothetical protein